MLQATPARERGAVISIATKMKTSTRYSTSVLIFSDQFIRERLQEDKTVLLGLISINRKIGLKAG